MLLQKLPDCWILILKEILYGCLVHSFNGVMSSVAEILDSGHGSGVNACN